MSDLEYQAATLATRYAALWIAGAHVFVGVLQCAVVAWAFALWSAPTTNAPPAPRRTGAKTAKPGAKTARPRREDREALEAARREDREAREAARREADQRHAETMEAFKTQARALEALIERTAPGAAH